MKTIRRLDVHVPEVPGGNLVSSSLHVYILHVLWAVRVEVIGGPRKHCACCFPIISGALVRQ